MSGRVNTVDGDVDVVSAKPSTRQRERRRRRDAVNAGRARAASWWLTCLLVPGSALALGTVHLPAIITMGILAACLGVLLAVSGARVPVVAWWLWALAGYSAVQAVPLPLSVVEAVTPRTALEWTETYRTLSAPQPSWLPISLDPGASLLEAVKWSSYGSVAWAIASKVRRRGASPVALLAVLSAVAVGAVTLGHGLAAARSVYGLYVPSFTPGRWHVGPLLNPNNLAAHAVLGTMAAIGIAVAERPRVPRWASGLAAAFLVAVCLSTASRVGVVALVLGLVAMAVALLLKRRGSEERIGRGPVIGVASVVVAGVAIGLLSLPADLARELFTTKTGKLRLIADTRHLIAEYPGFGVGRGAFETAFSAHARIDKNVVFAHAESFPAQWLSEWGIPVGLAAMLALAACVVRSAGCVRESAAIGLWVGVAAMLVHNLLDLGVEVAGVAMLAVAALAAVCVSLESSAQRASTPLRSARVAGLVPMVTVVIATGLVASGYRTAFADRADLYAELETADAPERYRELKARAERAAKRHPADPHVAYVGALAAYHSGENALPWVRRALQRGPTDPRPHLLLAQMLRRRGATAQALLHLRLAYERRSGLGKVAASLATEWAGDFEEARAVVPRDASGSTMLLHMADAYARRGRHGDQKRALVEATVAAPDALEPRIALGRLLLDAWRAGRAPCAAEAADACSAELDAQITELQRRHPTATETVLLTARALDARGDSGKAREHLKMRCTDASAAPECLRLLARMQARADDFDGFDRTAKNLLLAECAKPADCAAAAKKLGDLMQERGQPALAITYYRRACRERPDDADAWSRLAGAASQSGAHAEATRAYERLLRLRGNDPAIRRKLDDQRTRQLGSQRGPP